MYLWCGCNSIQSPIAMAFPFVISSCQLSWKNCWYEYIAEGERERDKKRLLKAAFIVMNKIKKNGKL